IHGGWTSWSSWGTCFSDCEHHRLRSCTNPTPQHGGTNCTGDDTLSKECTGDLCKPIHGGWSSWSSWGMCSSDCQHHRSRSCNNPTPQHGGTNCTGDNTLSQGCTGGMCTRVCPDGYVEIESQCFFMANERMNWDNAKKRCEGLSSQLASPEFPMALRDFVINNFSKLSFWIGGRYNENSDVWQWLSGAPFSTSFPWGINDRGEQQDKGEHQHCMILRYFPIQDEQEYVDNRCEKMNYF
ncbi:unnamed protein product, partial [Meganyctiphanes norvegica]